MSVFQRPSPRKTPRFNHATRVLGIRTTVLDSRAPQTAAYAPVVSSDEVKSLQNAMGVARADDSREIIIGRLVSVHECAAKLKDAGARCDKCKSRIPAHDADLKVATGEYRWLESTKADGSAYRMRAIVKTDTPIVEETVLVHLCSGRAKRCYCGHRIPASQAESMIAARQADWALVKRGTQEYKTRRSIVLSASEKARIREEVRKQKLLHNKFIQPFRNALSDRGFEIRDGELWEALNGTPIFEGAYAELNQVFDGTGKALGCALTVTNPKLGDLFLRALGWFWNRCIPVLMQHTYLGGSRRDEHIVITGGYDSIAGGKLDWCSTFAQLGGRQVSPEGAGPDDWSLEAEYVVSEPEPENADEDTAE